MPLQKVLAGGRITIPKGFRERYKIFVGDFVEVRQKGNKLIIIPVEVKVKEKK